jgi:nitrous oxidase accessory protein NosD
MNTKAISTLAILAATLFWVSSVAGTVLYVGVLEDYEEISSALDEAAAGDTISVEAGIWDVPDAVEIKIPGLVLQGENPATTILDGQNQAYAVVKVEAQGVVITGFTLRNGSSHGVYVNDSNWAVIDHNVIAGNGDRGILLGMGKPWATITGNTIVDNKVSAIYSYRDDPRTSIVNNIIAGNSRGIVTDSGVRHIRVENNCFWGQSTDNEQVSVGKGNIRADPLFADASGGDYGIAAASPCKGAARDGGNIGALAVVTRSTPVQPAPGAISGSVIEVSPGGGAAAIQRALESAGPGSTIKIPAGTWQVPEEITVKTSGVKLQGAGPDLTILDGMGAAYSVVNVGAPGVTIAGFTLRNGSSHGVYVSGDNWVTIDHNVITANKDRGILAGMGEPYAIITNNTIVANQVSAIYTYRNDSRTRIVNNIIADNSRGIVTDSDSLNHMTVGYNCFKGQSGDEEQVLAGRGSIRADPMFADPDHGDYRLKPGSPCIGKGENGQDIGAFGRAVSNPSPPPAPAANVDRSVFRIVVFAKDTALGSRILAGLRNAGFTNDRSYVAAKPNDYANVKFARPAESIVDAVVNVVSDLYKTALKREESSSDTDLDIFINLP